VLEEKACNSATSVVVVDGQPVVGEGTVVVYVPAAVTAVPSGSVWNSLGHRATSSEKNVEDSTVSATVTVLSHPFAAVNVETRLSEAVYACPFQVHASHAVTLKLVSMGSETVSSRVRTLSHPKAVV
jgi:hypothetical protein